MIACKRVLRFARVVITIDMLSVCFAMDRLLERSLEKFPNVSSLKDEQKEAVRQLLCSKDVIGILPTGFGKSLIYQLYATAKQMQENGNVVSLAAVFSVVTQFGCEGD